MNKSGFLPGERNLAQIESDLLQAEAEFVEANARLKEFERSCSVALSAINEHQAEFDQAVSAMRQRSIAGSKWQIEMGDSRGAMHLNGNESSEYVYPNSALHNSVTVEFEHLSKIADLEDASPCVILHKK